MNAKHELFFDQKFNIFKVSRRSTNSTKYAMGS